MTESEVDKYSLDCKTKHFSLKVCILDDVKLLMELSNKNGPEKYKAILTLEQLKDLCFAFYSFETINESLIVIKNTIESGKIAIEEKSANTIELELNIDYESVEYTSFVINLLLEENGASEENENIQKNPPIFNYHGNKELEAKYGNIDYDTTEVSSIVESKVKPKIMELEYIQPILQVHYPDGSTKNTPLTPTLQGADGKDPNMTEEQIESIKEMINRDTNRSSQSPINENFKRANSGGEVGEPDYSIRSMPILKKNNLGNNLINETESIGNNEINQEDIQKDNEETMGLNNEDGLLQAPSQSLLINDDNNESNNYRKSTSTLSAPPINMEPNIYQRNIYSVSSVPVYPRRYIQKQVTIQRRIYQPMQSIYQPIQRIYQTSTYRPIQRIYQTSAYQPTQSLYQTSAYQPTQTLYQTSVYQPTQNLYQTSVLQPLLQSSSYQPAQSLYQSIQFVPQPQINNMINQNYITPYYAGLNPNIQNSLYYPRNVYYPKLRK